MATKSRRQSRAVPSLELELTYPQGPVAAKYEAYVFSEHRETHWTGAFGTGKTSALATRAGLRRLKYHGSIGLVARSTMKALKSTTLVNFLALWSNFGRWYEADGVFEWDNGSKTYFFGLDSPNAESMLKSFEVLDVAIDEANEITEEMYETAIGRLRWQPQGPLLKEYLNPISGTPLAKSIVDKWGSTRISLPYCIYSISNYNGRDWLYYRYKIRQGSGERDMVNRLLLEASTTENHSLPEGYVENLIDTNSEEWVKRFVYGSYDIAYGRILHQFDKEKNVFSGEQKIPMHWAAYLAIDVGFSHPTAAILCRVSDDNRIWITDCYLQASRTSYDNAVAIKSMARGANLVSVVGSPDAFKTDATTGKTQTQEYIRAGLNLRPAVLEHDLSLNLVNQCMKPVAYEPDQVATPRIMISSHCVELIQQIEEMTWEKRRKKVDDDLYDALRMLIGTMPEGITQSVMKLNKGFHKNDIEEEDDVPAYVAGRQFRISRRPQRRTRGGY